MSFVGNAMLLRRCRSARAFSSISRPPKEACTSILGGVLARSSPILKTLPARGRRVSTALPQQLHDAGAAPCMTYSNLSINDFLFWLCARRGSSA